RARHVYATEDKNLHLVFKVNGHLSGDIIPAPQMGAELQISYSIRDDDEPGAAYTIEVWSGKIGGTAVSMLDSVSAAGNTIATATATASQTISDIHYSGGSEFVYFKVIQANEDGVPDRAWTAPVWFDDSSPAPGPIDDSQFVASKNSLVYHVSPNCRSAKAIKASNRITGSAAKEGRTQHVGCPVL
ncbi:MAG TPA: hypothetical protein VGR78_03375, partial [Verrucomicrobiae bacterium]|nr:hypothetical protein [Verrucomicrobiae bacterium]